MKLSQTIVVLALLGSIAVEGYGPRINQKRRGSSHGKQLNQLENHDLNEPHSPNDPYGEHGHTRSNRRHNYSPSLEDLRRQWYFGEESSESDSGFSSELYDDSSDSTEHSDWYMPVRRPCWGWRCPLSDANVPWTWTPASGITSPEVPTTERWNTMLKSSMRGHRSSETVTPSTVNPSLTVSPNLESILNKIAPLEEESVIVTTVTPETNPTTVNSSETTTVSQAILDCIESCVSTPEFNPVCGTNDQTYDNIGKLFCAKSCGINVELRRMSRCFPRFPFSDDYDDYDGNQSGNDSNSAGNGNVGDEDRIDDGDDRTVDGGDDRTVDGGDDRTGDGGSDSSSKLSLQPDDEALPPLAGDISPTLEQTTSQDNEPLSPVSDESSPAPSSYPFSPPNGEPLPLALSGRSLSGDEISLPRSADGNLVLTTASFLSSPTTTVPRFRRTTQLTDLQKCMKLCPVTITYNPICGTDLVTYINIDRMECARACGLEVQILCEQPCHVCNVDRQPSKSITISLTMASSIITPSTTALPTPVTPKTVPSINSRNDGKTTPATLKEQCIKACPITTEYNPICGSNNVNYTNPVHLLCVQMCGDDVKVARFGPCPPDTRAETTIATIEEDNEDVTVSPAIRECTRRCVVTTEYNPVCGTNEETYTNPGRLECAKYCGIEVELNYKGVCNGFFFSGFTSTNQSNNPLRGGKSTSSSTMLPLRTPASTSAPTTLSTISQSTESSTPSFLPLIYSSTTLSTSSTNTPTTLKDNGFDIDARYGNEDEEDLVRTKKLDPNRIVFPE